MNMEIIVVYAIAAGGLVSTAILIKCLSYLAPLKSIISTLLSKHLVYPYFLARHRFFGPWTRGGVLLSLLYLVANLFCLLYGAFSTSDTGRRAGDLSLVNMVALFMVPHLGFFSDIIGLSLHSGRKIHRAAGWMSMLLLTIHILIAILIERVGFSLRNVNNLFAAIGSFSAAVMVLLSFPFVRRFAYECFLRVHQGLAAVLLYATWRHLPAGRLMPRIYIYVSLGSLMVTTLFQVLLFCYHNGVLGSRGHPRAYISYDGTDGEEDKGGNAENAVMVRVVLPRAMKLDAGQYVNLWMPTVTLSSWIQTHPFMVTSWSQEKQSTLDLYVKAQRGLSATLLDRAQKSPNGTISFSAFVTGPHGLSVSVSQYESVLLVATGSGISAVLPYLKKLIYGYNTSTCRTRRVHLVWQLQTLDLAITAESSLNSLLKDDTLADGYILTISIFVESGEIMTFGKHQRAFIYQGLADYSEIIQAEASGDFIKRVPNAEEERGEMLVMVSATNSTRDRVWDIVRGYLHDRVAMSVLEFQPD